MLMHPVRTTKAPSTVLAETASSVTEQTALISTNALTILVTKMQTVKTPKALSVAIVKAASKEMVRTALTLTNAREISVTVKQMQNV